MADLTEGMRQGPISHAIRKARVFDRRAFSSFCWLHGKYEQEDLKMDGCGGRVVLHQRYMFVFHV